MNDLHEFSSIDFDGKMPITPNSTQFVFNSHDNNGWVLAHWPNAAGNCWTQVISPAGQFAQSCYLLDISPT